MKTWETKTNFAGRTTCNYVTEDGEIVATVTDLNDGEWTVFDKQDHAGTYTTIEAAKTKAEKVAR